MCPDSPFVDGDSTGTNAAAVGGAALPSPTLLQLEHTPVRREFNVLTKDSDKKKNASSHQSEEGYFVMSSNPRRRQILGLDTSPNGILAAVVGARPRGETTKIIQHTHSTSSVLFTRILVTADEHFTWLNGYVDSCINRMEGDANAGRKVCEPRPDLLWDFAKSLSMLCSDSLTTSQGKAIFVRILSQLRTGSGGETMVGAFWKMKVVCYLCRSVSWAADLLPDVIVELESEETRLRVAWAASAVSRFWNMYGGAENRTGSGGDFEKVSVGGSACDFFLPSNLKTISSKCLLGFSGILSSQQKTACLVMADWVVSMCQESASGGFAVTQSQGNDIARLYKWAGEENRQVASVTARDDDMAYFKTPSLPAPLREANMIGGSKIPFIDVEAQPLEHGSSALLGRCSRTLTIIWDVNSAMCVSCGRHASESSLEYEWLGPAAVCGVCGCLCLRMP
eukprot:g4420.t1